MNLFVVFVPVCLVDCLEDHLLLHYYQYNGLIQAPAGVIKVLAAGATIFNGLCDPGGATTIMIVGRFLYAFNGFNFGFDSVLVYGSPSMTAIATTFGRICNTFNEINVEILSEYIILTYANKSKVGFDCLNDIDGILQLYFVWKGIFLVIVIHHSRRNEKR